MADASRTTATADEDAKPFWEITICLDTEADRDRVYEAVEKVLHDMGQIGTLALQKWNPL